MDINVVKNLKRELGHINVLYVEDEEAVRRNTVSFLETFFSNVYTAQNGQEGLELFLKDDNSHDIKFIITDIEMPMLNGLEMAEEIKARNQEIPILVMSAYDNKEYLLSAISTGIDGYLLKPIDMDDFIVSIVKIQKKYFLDITVKLYGEYVWNCTKKEMYKRNEKIKLTKNESKLIDLLVSKDNVVSMETIDYNLFDEYEFSPKRVRNMVSRLNIKLGVSIIESVYGMGYKVKLFQ